MARRARIYLDANAFDALESDAATVDRISVLTNQKRVTWAISGINLDEVFGGTDSKSRLATAKQTCNRLLPVAASRQFKEVALLIDEMGEYSRGKRDRPHPCYSRRHPYPSTPSVLDWINRASPDEFSEAAQLSRERQARGKAVVRELDKMLLSLVEKNNRTPSCNVSFDQFRLGNLDLRAEGFMVSRPLASLRSRIKASNAKIPALDVVADALLYRAWAQIGCGGKPAASKKIWTEDIRQVVYCGVADVFVTEDSNYRTMLETIAPDGRLVVSYSDFVAWLSSR